MEGEEGQIVIPENLPSLKSVQAMCTSPGTMLHTLGDNDGVDDRLLGVFCFEDSWGLRNRWLHHS
jgi:hypothetical protein